MSSPIRLILGSSSPSRLAVMDELGIPFETMAADVDEKSIRAETPRALTIRLAIEKGRVLKERVSRESTRGEAIIITADTVVTCAGIMREKPTSYDEAREFLRSYREHPAQVITAMLGCHVPSGHEDLVVDFATVRFAGLTDEAIEALVESGVPMFGAGAFCAGHELFRPHILRVQGTLDSAMGLPKQLLLAMIESLTPKKR